MTRKTQILILTLLSIVFFFAYSSYLMGREVSFTTPDENVNLFYTRYVAENHSIVYEDALNESLDTTAIRPRGMRYQEGKIVPNLFFGMYFIYGGFQQVFGFLHLPDSAVLYLNPLFAVIGVWLLYFLVGEVFDEKTALISACLLFVLPPYWYWGSLFFSNILAVVLFIAALLFLQSPQPGAAGILCAGGPVLRPHRVRQAGFRLSLPFRTGPDAGPLAFYQDKVPGIGGAHLRALNGPAASPE